MEKSTIDAIRTARENGHICMINTGRTKRLVGKEISEQVEFDGYLLGCGTMIVYRNEIILHKTLTMDQSERILKALKKYRIDALLEGAEENFSVAPEQMYTEYFKEFAQNFINKNYDTFENALGRYDKLFAYVDNVERMEAFQKEFSKELDFIERENDCVEIVPKGYSKATAIQYMAKKLGISMEDTVAIGDSNNDLPMLQCAKISIAMGNSMQKVLDVADYITTDVGKDGIWNALKWLGVL